MAEIRIDGQGLTPAMLARIASGATAGLTDAARERMKVSADWYGQRPDSDIIRQKWQWIGGGASPGDRVKRFIEGHCAGIGEPLPKPWVRAVMAARANTLATGHSGARPEAAEVLLSMLDADVIPVVPVQGSVGSAGSVALAHVARVACGLGGEAWVGESRVEAVTAMADLATLQPTEKDALSLINGSTLGTALAALAVWQARELLHAAEAACALTMEVVRADLRCLSARALDARRHAGAAQCGERLRAYLEGSELVTEGRRPDSFSIRCSPTVLGAAWDALEHAEAVVTRELNASGDNPLVFAGIEVVEAGNFHGAPVAMAMDYLRIALTGVASIAERRIYRLTYGDLSGLPSFLVPGTGVNSGLMLAQYTAASLVSECKGLAHPASVDAIPAVQHHEDHNSMAPIAARAALEVVELVSDVVAIELLCGAQGLEFRLEGTDGDGAHRPGHGSMRVFTDVRKRVTRWVEDRELHDDLVALGNAVRDGVFSIRPTDRRTAAG